MGINFVMLIEIPDPEVILGVILAFIIGLGGLYAFYKIRPYVKTSSEMNDASQAERLEYYERQLIDMKIRLDALEIERVEQKDDDSSLELKQLLQQLVKKEEDEDDKVEKIVPTKQEKPKEIELTPSFDSNDVTEQVLQLITTKAMTSRDIQKALRKSREHTSRLMKKLFDDGYVNRNTESKPYTYSISDKGRKKIGVLESNPTVV